MLSKTLIKYCSLFLSHIDKDDIRIFLESSPQYPNLLAALQTLRYAGLDAEAGQCDYEHLKTLDTPFLLHLKIANKENLIISRWNSAHNSLELFNLKFKKWKEADKKHISNSWDGVVMYTNNPVLSSMTIKWGKQIKAFTICCLLLLASYLFFHSSLFYLMPIIIGFVVGCSLFIESELEEDGFIERLCHISAITDCTSVAESEYSSIFGIKMNNLALSFFFSQLIAACIGIMFDIMNIVSSLYLFSALISIPVIVYSIYAQCRIGKICPLCVIIALCIVSEAAIFIIGYRSHDLNVKFLSFFCILFMWSVAALRYMLKIKRKGIERVSDGIQFLKLKRKKETIFSESSPASSLNSPIWIGEKDSPTHLTTVISPGCNHCKKVVSELLLLHHKGMKFKWNLILGQTTHKDADLIDIWINRYLIDKKKFLDELILWSNGSYQISSSLSTDSLETIELNRIRLSFNKQIAQLNISGFPRIILNDRLLSPIYTATDLKFLIEDKL